MSIIDEIRARERAATPGPWKTKRQTLQYIYENTVITETGELITKKDENCAFIAHAREDIPYLLGEIKRITAELECKNPPEPLSFAQFKALEESTPVWVVDGCKNATWALINSDGDCIDSDTGLWDASFYGLSGDGYMGLHHSGWLAYDRPPKEPRP